MVRLDDCDSSYVGLEDPQSVAVSFEAYPNPTRDVVNIRTNATLDVAIEQIVILGANGQLHGIMETGDWTQQNAGEISIDLSQLASGVYYLRVQHAYGNNNLRVVIGK